LGPLVLCFEPPGGPRALVFHVKEIVMPHYNDNWDYINNEQSDLLPFDLNLTEIEEDVNEE